MLVWNQRPRNIWIWDVGPSQVCRWGNWVCCGARGDWPCLRVHLGDPAMLRGPVWGNAGSLASERSVQLPNVYNRSEGAGMRGPGFTEHLTSFSLLPSLSPSLTPFLLSISPLSLSLSPSPPPLFLHKLWNASSCAQRRPEMLKI